MRIYISGPITGEKRYKEIFEKAERELEARGYKVINPAKMDEVMPDDTTWEEYMEVSGALLSFADGIYMLEGWEKSKGARMEYEWAKEQGKNIYQQNRERKE